MKTILKVEEAAITALAIYYLTFHSLGLPLWVWALLFFSPDISMLGYMAGTRTGATTYNLFHHKGLALVVGAIGYILNMEVILAIGILLFAHASFDRVWGYGLKYSTGLATRIWEVSKRSK